MVQPFQQIVIDAIAPSDPAYAQAGSLLSISGTSLDDANFKLFIDGTDSTTLVVNNSATLVTARLPATIGSTFRAGAIGVQIEHPVLYDAASCARARNPISCPSSCIRR